MRERYPGQKAFGYITVVAVLNALTARILSFFVDTQALLQKPQWSRGCLVSVGQC